MVREDIYTALFSLLQSKLGSLINTYSRRLVLWSEIPSSQQPALYISQSGESVHQNRLGIPATFEMDATIWVYVNVGESLSAVPSTTMNPIIDAIINALNPKPLEKQTLGLAYVSHCWISGRIEIFEGILGSQAITLIPIKTLATF